MKTKSKPYTISVKGSLGVLAYGDIAFKEWREVKKKFKNKKNEQKK